MALFVSIDSFSLLFNLSFKLRLFTSFANASKALDSASLASSAFCDLRLSSYAFSAFLLASTPLFHAAIDVTAKPTPATRGANGPLIIAACPVNANPAENVATPDSTLAALPALVLLSPPMKPAIFSPWPEMALKAIIVANEVPPASLLAVDPTAPMVLPIPPIMPLDLDPVNVLLPESSTSVPINRENLLPNPPT